jgi:vacuolar-type H+-ATPase subunit E/Vma4
MADRATTTADPRQEDKLVAEMRQDAERKAKRTTDRAEREAKKAIDEARQAALQQREARMAEATREAGERSQAILAGVEHERRSRELVRREAIIEEVLSAAYSRAAELSGDARAQALRQLLQEAVCGMPHAARVVVRCPAEDCSLLRSEVAKAKIEAEVVEDDDIRMGLVVEEKDGSRVYDNTLRSRALRLREALRRTAFASLAGESSRGEDRHAAGGAGASKQG